MDLEKIVKESKTWKEVCIKIYGKKNSTRVKKLKTLANDLNIDYSHFINNSKRPRIKKFCPVCGSQFYSRIGYKEQITCSHGCSNTYFKTKHDSYNNYRNRAISKYGNVCAICGETRSHVLQVHHIDNNRKNNLIDNLIVVCSNCHLDLHFKLNTDI